MPVSRCEKPIYSSIMSAKQKVGKQRVFDAEKLQAKAPPAKEFDVSHIPTKMPPPMQLMANPLSAGPMQLEAEEEMEGEKGPELAGSEKKTAHKFISGEEFEKGTSKSKVGIKTAGSEKGQAVGGVYILVDEEGVVKRTGRTKNHATRRKQHEKSDDTKHLMYEEAFFSDDYKTQRGLEHLLYEEHGETAHKDNGGLNKIKAIADKNDNKDEYLKKAYNFLNLMSS